MDTNSTLEWLAAELSAQLTRTVTGFAQAAHEVGAALTEQDRRTLGSFDAAVRLPLARCHGPGARIHIVIDGLDKPQPGARELIGKAVAQLTDSASNAELDHVHIIVGARSGQGIEASSALAHAHRIDVSPPSLPANTKAASALSPLPLPETDLTLVTELLAEIAAHSTKPPTEQDLSALVHTRIEAALQPGGDPLGVRMLAMLAAAGVGPLLPIGLLAAAVGGEEPVPLARVRDRAVGLGTLISRGNPGTDDETLGIAYAALLDPITDYTSGRNVPLALAHHLIIDAHSATATPNASTPTGRPPHPATTCSAASPAGDRYFGGMRQSPRRRQP